MTGGIVKSALRPPLFLCAALLLLVAGRWAAYYAGATPYTHWPLEPGNVVVPGGRSLVWRDQSKTTDRILEHWANHPLGDWQTDGKIAAPRALTARFLLGHDLVAANEYLRMKIPWGQAGSSWGLHQQGDFDFTMAALVPILFLFGNDPDVLYPGTREHLLHVLLPLEGGEPRCTVPRSLGLIRDTENHLLMTEGSRYLKNRWLARDGCTLEKHDNEANGLEPWLLQLIEELHSAGLYEFNSIPYEGYTLTALLNLEAFASEPLRRAARGLLDEINWKYALGSSDFRRFPPFRRRYTHAADTGLSGDRNVPLIKTWMSLLPQAPDRSLTGSHHIALWACWSPYRLPDKTAHWILNRPREYFIRIGHGPESSPEIYSGGPAHLLTAGGVNRGARSMIVARPITLLLDDGASDLSQVLHLADQGDDYREWNNTGVWKNFAVASGPVCVPSGWNPMAEAAGWIIYKQKELCIAVYSRVDIGIVFLCQNKRPRALLQDLATANATQRPLTHRFQVPGGDLIEYDTAAPKNRWVITKINGQAVDRKFDHWPRIEED